ncbi:uncharacterized protein LOC120090884 [Benincasa hispida]|uniref:uncharacterized protein LOC120090884 n=1 Tax=Benincasa hispida TaxID=102211 RepID=UPI001900D861|nr:uncharacterized protein LOC120090884 [Benincasa hispida]
MASRDFEPLGVMAFEGTTDLAEVKVWLDRIGKCFNVMNYPEDRKFGLVVFLLQKGAKKWWKMVSARQNSSIALLWPEFRKAYKDKYYPSSFREAKRDEFFRLVQGTLTVAKYEQKFMKLSQYALPIIAKEKYQCKRFENGLRKKIRTLVTSIAN